MRFGSWWCIMRFWRTLGCPMNSWASDSGIVRQQSRLERQIVGIDQMEQRSVILFLRRKGFPKKSSTTSLC
jgi:hypothetical protein